MHSLIYADHAATTPLDPAALEAMLPYLREEFGNASQSYFFSQRPRKALEDARRTIAKCIGAAPEEIFFTSGGTESDNWVIKSMGKAAAIEDLSRGRSESAAPEDLSRRELVTSSFEHAAVLRSCDSMERLGHPVYRINPSPEGRISVKALSSVLSDRTQLVSIMMANNELGTIQPIQELCAASHAYGALFHTDAVQAVGHVPIHVHELGVDFLSASAHKFNGPKGIGFLYVRKGITLQSYQSGGHQERNLRAGTENVASIVGMAAALEHNCEQMSMRKAHLQKLETLFLTHLAQKSLSYHRNGDAPFLPGLLSLSFPGADAEAMLHRLDLMGSCVSAGSACNSHENELSHVLRAIRLDQSLAVGTLRISFGHENTENDAIQLADDLAEICLDFF